MGILVFCNEWQQAHDPCALDGNRQAALVLSTGPGHEEIALRLTTLYLEQERFDQVLAWQNEEVETVVTRWNIARALAALEKTEEAVSAYQELYEDLKDNPEFLEAYVYLLREAGDATKAREVANQYLAIVPDDVQMQTLYDSL